MDLDIKKMLSASKMRMRIRSPYFSVLVGYLKVEQVAADSQCKTAATDERKLMVNAEYLRSLGAEEHDALLVHEVLHAAMGHCWRVGPRHPFVWNVAADYVVNLILTGAGYKVGHDWLYDRKYAGMTVEEVYALLVDEATGTNYLPGPGSDVLSPGAPDSGAMNDAYWKSARASAEVASKMYGHDPLLDKIKVQVERSITDWRQYLWDNLSFSSNDFGAWDRRLIHDEIYVEELEAEEKTLRCAIFIDSSGSMLGILGKVIGEVEQIRSLYPQLEVHAYFADADVHGPVSLDDLRNPRGGGGTSFVSALELADNEGYERALYLTDLEGTFPEEPPNVDTIWAVPAGCVVSPPFGRVIKIL